MPISMAETTTGSIHMQEKEIETGRKNPSDAP
jgi:hypothetical protein